MRHKKRKGPVRRRRGPFWWWRALYYRMQPGDDPPVAVVVEVAAAKQSLSIERGSQMQPAVVNENLAAERRNARFPSQTVIASSDADFRLRPVTSTST